MELLMFSVALALLCPAHSSTTTPQRHDIAITTSSSNIHQGFTKDLDIICSFNQQNNSDFGIVMSVSLSKTSTPEDSDYTEIAYINSNQPDKVTITSSLGADVTGRLDTHVGSFIQYAWHYPSNDVEGNYKCSVQGLDHIGHPLSAVATTMVQEKSVDLNMILEKMKALEINQEHLIEDLNRTRSELHNTSSQLTSTKVELDHTKDNLIKTNDELTRLQSRVNNSVSVLFANSTTFRNHRYYLSFPTYTNVYQAEGVCEMMGGYMVELNDEAEYNAVVSLIHNNIDEMSIYNTFLGVTDGAVDGIWRYIHSGTTLSFTNWALGEPNSINTNNCAVLNYKDMLMHDVPCFVNHMKFICELE